MDVSEFLLSNLALVPLGFIIGLTVAILFALSLFLAQRRKEASVREVSDQFSNYVSSSPRIDAENARTSYYDREGSKLVLRAFDPPDADKPDDVIPQSDSSGPWLAVDSKEPIISTSVFDYSSTAAPDEEHEPTNIWNFSVPVISSTGSVSGVITLDSDSALFEENDIPFVFPALPEGFRGLIIDDDYSDEEDETESPED